MEKWRFLGRFQVDNEAHFLEVISHAGGELACPYPQIVCHLAAEGAIKRAKSAV